VGDGARERTGWLLDEIASAGRENLDAAHVSRYDVKENADASGELRLLRRLGLEESSTVLDMGAGTGQLSLVLAPVCARVVAVDVSPVMQAHLEAKLEAAGVTNVECVRAGFLTYEHSGSLVDFAYSRYALHHLPDFWKALALARLGRFMRAGAVLRLSDVVYSFEPAEAEERIENWCASGGRAVESEWTRAELEEHVRDEHSTFTWLLEPMIERAGFRIEASEYSPDGIFASYVARRL
jgi:ubiquinone/menaquinone biosynthesis C-methylase UbiE